MTGRSLPSSFLGCNRSLTMGRPIYAFSSTCGMAPIGANTCAQPAAVSASRLYQVIPGSIVLFLEVSAPRHIAPKLHCTMTCKDLLYYNWGGCRRGRALHPCSRRKSSVVGRTQCCIPSAAHKASCFSTHSRDRTVRLPGEATPHPYADAICALNPRGSFDARE